jgi:hypothetical protein
MDMDTINDFMKVVQRSGGWVFIQGIIAMSESTPGGEEPLGEL